MDHLSLIKLETFLLVALYLLHDHANCQFDNEPQSLRPLNSTRLEDLISQDVYAYDELYGHSKCQPMNIPFCENVGYNKTMLPNLFGHQSQAEIIKDIDMFQAVSKVDCSADLKLFICTVYAPMCFDQGNYSKPTHLFPCRSLCESARRACASSLARITWPPGLACEKFPNKKGDCVSKDERKFMTNLLETSEKLDFASSIQNINISFRCPMNFEVPNYSLQLLGRIYPNCAMPCQDVLLDKNGTHIVRLVVAIMSIICLLSTLFTCMTFLLDTKRFRYPARPIIIISLCQFVVAACYLIGFVTNNKISCNDPLQPPKNLENMKMVRTITAGSKKGSCTLQFMILYFFQMSTMFWWLMMTISWYMIARLKWAPEAVSSVSRYFHLFSWTIPALLSIYLAVLGNIEGDPLTGTCYVTVSNQESIKSFVVYPILLCIMTGFFLLASGFKSLWESRETLRREYGKQTDEHNKLVLRIGIYSMLFITFSSTLIYCQYYEQSNLNAWMLNWWSNICKNQEYSIPCPKIMSIDRSPHYLIFIFKYLATMAIGIISAFFMLSEKTIMAYREMNLYSFKL